MSDAGSADRLGFGIYVHIPFCARRCDYCAFATWTDRHHLIAPYLAACRADIAKAVASAMAPASSVFFGGGTPSLVPGAELMSVLATIPRQPSAEVTVECNPDTVTSELLARYAEGGVTRLSFGVQSMVGHVLEALGRTHDPDAVDNAVALAGDAGFTDFNLDLIYGGVGESLADWDVTLQRALALDPPHISAYGLTVEAGTALADDPARHPDDDDQADKYLLADERLSEAGLVSYEISNWARPGHECRHNLLYWRQGDYAGFGCAAHSHRQGRRWWNVRTPERYIAAIEGGGDPMSAAEDLDADGRRLEGLQLSVRTSDGLAPDSVPVELADLGLFERRADRAVLTVKGRLLANEVAVRLT